MIKMKKVKTLRELQDRIIKEVKKEYDEESLQKILDYVIKNKPEYVDDIYAILIDNKKLEEVI